MHRVQFDERRSVHRLDEMTRFGINSFAGVSGKSYPSGEDGTIEWPYRRVIGARITRMVRQVRKAQRGR